MNKVKDIYLELFEMFNAKNDANESKALTELLLFEVCNVTRNDIIINEKVIEENLVVKLRKYSKPISEGVPIQYILGKASFYGRDFYVDKDVLIPRPETEELVHWIIEDSGQKAKILDIGTGSGCIAISLALEIKKSEVSAMDVSRPALKVAKRNATNLKANVQWIEKNVLTLKQLSSQYDIIVSNPPYVMECEKEFMKENVLGHEPHLALFVNDHTPLVFYHKIASLAFHSLEDKGKLYFEINEKFGKEIKAYLEEMGFCDVIIKQDINGKDRMIRAEKSKAS